MATLTSETATMSPTEFQNIRAAVQFHPTDCFNADMIERDPLYHSQIMLKHFQKQCMSVAVPCGASALDKNSIRTSAHTKAKQHMDNKPVKYALHYYASIDTREMYIHTFWNNGWGIITSGMIS